jgi:quinol-cytochrome oxidoreductase complex cytochrome b subunit
MYAHEHAVPVDKIHEVGYSSPESTVSGEGWVVAPIYMRWVTPKVDRKRGRMGRRRPVHDAIGCLGGYYCKVLGNCRFRVTVGHVESMAFKL